MLESILDVVSRSASAFKDRPLTAFDTVVGKKWNGELLLIGRAVNGWGEAWEPEQANTPSSRVQLADSVRDVVARGRECPMSWVTEHWSAGKEYNTAGSAFWRVAKAVTHDLAIVEDGVNWASHLAHTNLYRVSPYQGGNPSSALCKVQEEACIGALATDLDRLEPRRILFLTGQDWADPFLGRLGKWIPAQGESAGIAAAGRLERGGRSIRVVVADHPQGRPELPMTRGIARGWEIA